MTTPVNGAEDKIGPGSHLPSALLRFLTKPNPLEHPETKEEHNGVSASAEGSRDRGGVALDDVHDALTSLRRHPPVISIGLEQLLASHLERLKSPPLSYGSFSTA